jgi:hypothetical protein
MTYRRTVADGDGGTRCTAATTAFPRPVRTAVGLLDSDPAGGEASRW